MTSFDSTLSNLTSLQRGFSKNSCTVPEPPPAVLLPSRTSSRPPPSRASPSNVIDVHEINDTAGGNGDGAEAPATSTSARRCRSVASAPTRPSRPLDPFSAPKYSQSAYAGSSKGKGGPSSKRRQGSVRMGQQFLDIEPNTWISRPSRNEPSWGGEPNTSNKNNDDNV